MDVRRFQPRYESLEDRITPAVAADEQLFVYLLNLARSNPPAWAIEQSLPVSLASADPQPPLAVNDLLFDSSEFHAQDMATNNYFGHNTQNGTTPNQMVEDTGYILPDFYPNAANNVESIAAGNELDTTLEVLNALLVDDSVDPPAHRFQLLGMNDFFADHREIGVGHALNGSADFEHYWAIHTARRNADTKFLTGVVFNDVNGNNRYDLTEGISGVTINVAGVGSVNSNAAGGWSMLVPQATSGGLTVTASGGGVNATADVNMGSSNIEVDFLAGQSTGVVNFSGVAANSAPVLDTSPTPTLPAIPEDSTDPAGTLISALVGGAISDVNTGDASGIAVIGVTGSGTWEFDPGGGNWTNISGVSAASALLLPDNYELRLVPDPDFAGLATLSFRAWDQTDGTAEAFVDLSTPGSTGGTSAFSSASDSMRISVQEINDAPTLDDSGNPALPSISEDTAKSAARTIANLVGAAIGDPDSNAKAGVAIVGQSGTGTWQYSIDGGTTYKAIGAVSAATARLLRDVDRIRFKPAKNFNGTATITVQAWDRTAGTKGSLFNTVGSTAFSVTQETIEIVVTPRNDAPVLNNSGTPTVPDQNGSTVSSIIAGLVSDVDAGALQGIAVTGLTGTANGLWQYFDTNVSDWVSFGSVSASSARLLRASDQIRFVPNGGFTGTVSITFRAWDQTTGAVFGIANLSGTGATGGTTAFSSAVETAALTVS